MTLASEILADSPVIYLKLDEASGSTATDSSGNANHFTYTAAAAFRNKIMPNGDYGVGTDGSDSIATLSSVPAALANPTAFTLECAVFIETTVEKGGFIAVGNNGANGYCYGVGNNSTFEGTGNKFDGLADTLAWKNTGVDLGTGWKHCVLARDGSGWYYYIGGALVSTQGAQAIVTATTKIYAGGYTASSRHMSAGNALAHAAIYSSRLSAARIAAHADAFRNAVIMDDLIGGAVGSQPNPWMPFGEHIAGGGGGGGGGTPPTTGQLWPRGNLP